MSKITQLAISQKLIDQNQNKILFLTTYFYTFLKIFDWKFNIATATEGW